VLVDADTLLLRFGARDYDAQTGRWTARDPVRFSGGHNPFVYVENEPISGMDAAGLACLKEQVNMVFCSVGALFCILDPSHWSCFVAGATCYEASSALAKCQGDQPPEPPRPHPYCEPGASPGPDSDECRPECRP